MPAAKKFSSDQFEHIRVNFGANAAHGNTSVPVDDYYEVVEAREAHSVLGTDAGAVTLTVEKLTGTQAPAGGVNTLTTTFNMKSTINTVVKLSRSTTLANIRLSPGDRLGFTFAGVLTALVGVGVEVVLKRTRPFSQKIR